MPTVSELRALGGHLQFAHILLFDGVQQGAFTDHSDLVGFDTGTGHDVRLGLQRDASLRMAVDLRTGQFEDSTSSFTINDFEGDLASLFAVIDPTERPLHDVPVGGGASISPSEDLTARTDLHGLNVGTERIGSTGDRHQYSCIPGFEIGGEHLIGAPSLDLPSSPVSANPIVWASRRCSLWRVYRDHVTYPNSHAGPSSWRPFSEARRIWWGTLKDQGVVSGHEWRFEADGPESWLRKTLGIGYQRDPVRTTSVFELHSSERFITVILNLEHPSGSRFRFGQILNDSLVATTVEELRDEIATFIETASTTAGPDGTWADDPGFSVGMDSSGAVRIEVPLDQGAYWLDGSVAVGRMLITVHRKVWQLLGYDLEQQAALWPDPDDPKAINFNVNSEITGDTYWSGHFVTGGIDPEIWPDGVANNGAVREYQPRFSGGTTILYADPTQAGQAAGQIVFLGDGTLGADSTTISHRGQLDRPPLSDPDDPTSAYEIPGIGAVDRQGLLLFFGKRRFQNSDDEFDEYQIARCSWQDSAGLINGDTVIVHEWLEPERFGFDRPRLESDWVGRADAEIEDSIRAVPILVLGYQSGSSYESAHVVLQRLLLATGTSSGWDSYSADPSATLDVGDNEPVQAHTIVRDGEVAGLGLGIPQEMVATPLAWQAEAGLVEEQTMLNVKTVFTPGMQAEDLIQGLTQPIGWCWHLRDGRYGVFCPAHSLTLADAVAVLDRSTKAVTYGDEDNRTQQDLRAWAPIDKFHIDYSWAPYTNKFSQNRETDSPDVGTRYRTGGQTAKISAHAHRVLDGWYSRVAVLGKWWARRHFWVRGFPVFCDDPGGDIWPGSIVRFSDPECVDPAGGYGVENRLGIVTSTNEDLASGSKTLDILVLADASITPKLHAISARGIGFDTTNNRIYVEDNWLSLETGGTWSDAALFVEPTYTGIDAFGGNARVQWLQWDGSSWSITGSATVTSVVTTPGSSYIQLSGAPTGTYWAYMDTIVVLDRYADQTANSWPTVLYAPICDEAGLYGGQPGIPWVA